MANFTGQTVLITGAGSGIGRACALAFAQSGARVIVADLDAAAGQETLSLMPDAACASFLQMDVGDAPAVQAQLAALLASTVVDVLVNSAGIGATQPFLETDMQMFDRMLAINLRGTFACAQAVARAMVDRRQGGVIINIGSASGTRGNAGRAAYGATKAAVANLTQVMAVELASHGIRVNAVAPGPIETPLVAAAHSNAVRQAWLRELPMARYGTAEDVSQAVLYLADPMARYVTGHVLHVDGGFQAAGIMSD